MNWFQHDTDLRNKPFMVLARNDYGNTAYAFYLMVLEIYAKDFNMTDEKNQLKVDTKRMRENARISEKKMKILLTHFQKHGKIKYRINEGIIEFKIPNIIEIASNWTKKLEGKKLRSTTEVTTSIEREEEIEKEEEKKHIRERHSTQKDNFKDLNEEKIFGDIVTLKGSEYLNLIKEYGEEYIKKYIKRMNDYCVMNNKEYKNYDRALRKWMNEDGIKIIKSEKVRMNKDDFENSELEEERKLKLFIDEYEKIDKKIYEEMNVHAYEAFIRPLRIKEENEKEIILFSRDARWLNEHYHEIIKNLLNDMRKLIITSEI